MAVKGVNALGSMLNPRALYPPTHPPIMLRVIFIPTSIYSSSKQTCLKPRVVVTTYKVFITRNNFDQYLKKLKKNTGHLILQETVKEVDEDIERFGNSF